MPIVHLRTRAERDYEIVQRYRHSPLASSLRREANAIANDKERLASLWDYVHEKDKAEMKRLYRPAPPGLECLKQG